MRADRGYRSRCPRLSPPGEQNVLRVSWPGASRPEKLSCNGRWLSRPFHRRGRNYSYMPQPPRYASQPRRRHPSSPQPASVSPDVPSRESTSRVRFPSGGSHASAELSAAVRTPFPSGLSSRWSPLFPSVSWANPYGRLHLPASIIHHSLGRKVMRLTKAWS